MRRSPSNAMKRCWRFVVCLWFLLAIPAMQVFPPEELPPGFSIN